jgi:hypothetical protein
MSLSQSTPYYAVFTPSSQKTSNITLVADRDQKVIIMEKIHLNTDIKVFGFEVKTFPEGIGEAFDALVKKVPDGFGRDYYGITFRDTNNRVVYLATAVEKENGEAEKYECERFTITKGDYATETVWNWRTKTDLIKHVFDHLFNTIQGTPTGPCIEWYKDNDEMLCMVRLAQTY